MTIQQAIKNKNISIYRLSKLSSIPYATVNDIYSGKSRLEKCSAETIYRIALALDVSMEELLAPCFLERCSFDSFKSAICHRVKEMGDIDFIIDTLETDDIRTFYELKWYEESLYLLGMLDYLCRENEVPICNDYDDLRRLKLEKPIFPSSLLALSVVLEDDSILKNAAKTAIPEFARFNIIENEVRNVV